MERSIIFLVLLCLLSPTPASTSATDCIDGIYSALSYFTFAGTEEGYYDIVCQNDLSLHSMWGAAKLYCKQKEIEAGSDMLSGYCTEYGMVELVPYSKILPDLTDEFIASLPVVNFADMEDTTKIWNTSILLSKEFYHISRKTTSVWSMEYARHQTYGWAVYGFWGGLLVIGMVNRLWTHVLAARRAATSRDIEDNEVVAAPKPHASSPLSFLNTAHHWVRANFIIPAAFGSHHQRLFWWCTIPTRMETTVVLAFWILNLVLCCVGYEIFWPNLYYTKAIQTWRYVADRTGIICYANLPILWMFSGRNNIFLWLTGWSFSTFNIFHRNVARIATIQAIVHSIGYTAIEANFGYLAASWREKYWYMGGMATIAMSLLLGFSSIWIRRHTYEIFLLLHIALSVLTIVGLFYHTDIFDGEWDPYLWPLVAIWLFDRFARVVRVAYCNLHVKLSSAPTTTSTTATYDKDSDLIRMEVIPGSQMLKPGPGQHYYLYQPSKWRCWENHPFTLGAWYAPDHPSETLLASSPPCDQHGKGLDKEVGVVGTVPASQESSTAASLSSQEGRGERSVAQNTLIFFVRPFSSWTMRLRDECLKSPSGTIKPRVLIEGPYGERSPLHTYENVVFIVGGTGVSGALPYLQEHASRTKAQAAGASKNGTRTRDITFIWTTKQSAMIRDIARRELQPYLGRKDIHFSFHVTSPKETAAPLSIEPAEKSAGASADVEIFYSRPHVQDAVLGVIDEVHAAGSAGGRIAILTCGPAAMADEARVAVHRALKAGKRGVEYFEETFGW